MTDRQRIEAAFQRAREELGIVCEFPAEVRAAAAEAARAPAELPRADRTEVPFLTVDPPGSRDLDQALHIERAGGGFRVCYAIADVGSWVVRGGVVERAAWERGVTHYAPDRRAPLYPEVLSQGAASLLPGKRRPAVLFSLRLDGAGALAGTRVERAWVRSREQLTYQDALAGARGGGEGTLPLLREVGELRLQRERERGGVSLPVRDQHVQQRAALRLGYHLEYEEPNPAEEWNAQISLLTGHAAALRMLAAGVGLLRVQPPAGADAVERVRTAARALGFRWPAGVEYPAFIHSLDLDHPHLPALAWQAKRLMRGADYAAFQGEPPEQPLHSALAMPYAHCTAPLRRLADRYVLDLLLRLEAGESPSAEEAATLHRLPPVMDEAERRAGRLERRVVNIAEAWALRGRVGERFRALVLGAGPGYLDAQLRDEPVRARIPLEDGAPPPALGEEITLRLREVEVGRGEMGFEQVTGNR